MLASLLLLYYGRVVEKRERVVAGQAYAVSKSRIVPQDQSIESGHLVVKAKYAILRVLEHASRPLSSLVRVGPYMILVGLGGTILWGVSWLFIPSVKDSVAGIVVPSAILICFFGGVVLLILGALASIAREW
jgi:hypothetical protein